MKLTISTILFLLSFSVIAQKKITINVGGSVAGSSTGTTDSTRLSVKGILSNADISFGSSSFGTDQTSAIQTILNTASATNPLYLIWDVKASVTGLKIKSHTYIFALPNCGAILRDNSDNFIFYNYNWVGQSNAFVDSNITIDGGIWNGNGYRGGTGKQIHSNSTKGMTTGFSFSGVKNITLKNLSLINSRTFGMLFMTTEKLKIDGLTLDQGTAPIINQDGIDIIGYAKNITIINSNFRTGDDRIAFGPNAAGGSISTEHHEPYTGVNGDQDHIRIDNIYFNGKGKGVSLYSTGGNQMYDFFISNISGTSDSYWFGCFNRDVFGYPGGYTITVGSYVPKGILIENVNVEVSSYSSYDPAGYPLVVLACNIDDITFRNIKRTDYTLTGNTFKVYKTGSTTVTINNLTIDNYTSINASPGQVVNHFDIAGATVTNMKVINSNIDLGGSVRNAAFVKTSSGGVITSLNMSNNKINSLKYLVNNAGTVTSLNVNGICHTGQGGSDATVLTSGTLTSATISNWIGQLLTSGTIGTLKGDGTL